MSILTKFQVAPPKENHRTRTFLFNVSKQFLVMNRIYTTPGVPNYLLLPGGGVDDGETPEQANIRELQEELGIRVISQKLLTIVKMLRDYKGWKPDDPTYSERQLFVYHFYTVKFSGVPVVKEPEKFEGLYWVHVKDLEALQKKTGSVLGDGIQEAFAHLKNL